MSVQDPASLAVTWHGGVKLVPSSYIVILFCHVRNKNHAEGKKNTQPQPAQLKCAGSMPNPARLAMTWHRGGKTSAVFLRRVSAVPRVSSGEEKQKQTPRGKKHAAVVCLAEVHRERTRPCVLSCDPAWSGEKTVLFSCIVVLLCYRFLPGRGEKNHAGEKIHRCSLLD